MDHISCSPLTCIFSNCGDVSSDWDQLMQHLTKMHRFKARGLTMTKIMTMQQRQWQRQWQCNKDNRKDNDNVTKTMTMTKLHRFNASSLARKVSRWMGRKSTSGRRGPSLLSCNICGEEIFLFPTLIFVMKQRNKQTLEWTSLCSPATYVVRRFFYFPLLYLLWNKETNKHQNEQVPALL